MHSGQCATSSPIAAETAMITISVNPIKKMRRMVVRSSPTVKVYLELDAAAGRRAPAGVR